MINIEVEKSENESTASLLRRFTRSVRGSGVLRHVRKIRYHQRPKSKFTQKKSALKMLVKKNKYDELVKLGKIAEQPRQTNFKR